MQLDSGVVPGAAPKMLSILLTLATFHEPMFWLNVDAESNMLAMFATAATFQLERFWSKAEAPLNV